MRASAAGTSSGVSAEMISTGSLKSSDGGPLPELLSRRTKVSERAPGSSA
jgi:hypothetical protein